MTTRATSPPSKGRATCRRTCALARSVHPPAGARGARPSWWHGSVGAADLWLSELIWRDFYHQVLHHHPRVVNAGLQARVRRDPLGTRPARRGLVRRLVRGPHRLPAGGRGDAPDQPDRLHAQPAAHGGGELPGEGPGHRLALRRGATSPPHLNDYDLAANNGGWQWAASTGCDAQPYFRIFNPVSAERKASMPQASSSAATCRRWPSCRTSADARALAGAAGGPGGRGHRDWVATTRADRRCTTPRARSARWHAYAVVKSPRSADPRMGRGRQKSSTSPDLGFVVPPARRAATRSAWLCTWLRPCVLGEVHRLVGALEGRAGRVAAAELGVADAETVMLPHLREGVACSVFARRRSMAMRGILHRGAAAHQHHELLAAEAVQAVVVAEAAAHQARHQQQHLVADQVAVVVVDRLEVVDVDHAPANGVPGGRSCGMPLDGHRSAMQRPTAPRLADAATCRKLSSKVLRLSRPVSMSRSL